MSRRFRLSIQLLRMEVKEPHIHPAVAGNDRSVFLYSIAMYKCVRVDASTTRPTHRDDIQSSPYIPLFNTNVGRV